MDPETTSLKINIIGTNTNDDPSFRYKMPRITVKYEGRGNGKKTCLTNLKDVAESLHRTPDEIIKFMGIDIGAQSKYIEKEQCHILNGHHIISDINNSLNKYIDIFVICPKCNLPEIPKYKVKNKTIKMKCLACGNRYTLDSTDHKLCSFIIAKTKKLKQQSQNNK
tara:strand:+ start:5281 stop:5778 length:498 start_codon:yes stop_codon:yes gene_type:complete